MGSITRPQDECPDILKRIDRFLSFFEETFNLGKFVTQKIGNPAL